MKHVDGTMEPRWLSTRASLLLGAAAVATFEIAAEFEAAAPVVIVYLACSFALARVKSTRWAFYLGLAIGWAIAALQLQFFVDLFGWAAVGLWAGFGIWIAFFLLLSRIVVGRWPLYGVLWLPVIWLGLEYFRCELYFLRFAWLTPGFLLPHPSSLPLLSAGVYGFSFITMCGAVGVQKCVKRKTAVAAACVVPVILFAPMSVSTETGPLVVGIQLEGAREPEVLAALDKAIDDEPDLDIVVLSEYCFDGPIPPAVLEWCAEHKKHLIAGGKESVDNGNRFFDTVFVVAPGGEIVFSQAKAVPVQFFSDGLPAREQRVWESPWGKIGIAICYDLAYARVIDRLIEAGAQALVIPAMDEHDWGEHEHRLHSKIAAVRAREYGVPIFRLASSGISQLVDRHGRVIASAPFPGQGKRLTGRLALGDAGKLPVDRYLAIPAVAAAGILILFLALDSVRARFRQSA
jgi:apolipoprotein N-acyltransferase